MEPFSVSFPPQRSRCNELPVPPLLVIIPAAPSHHKHVTIILTTRPYPMVHLGWEGGRPDAGENEGERGAPWVWWACLCVCVRGSLLWGKRHLHCCFRRGVLGFHPDAEYHRGCSFFMSFFVLCWCTEATNSITTTLPIGLCSYSK